MTSNDIFGIIAACAKEVLVDIDERVLARSDSLVNLGADSMARAEILMATLERLQLNIPRVELFGPTNLGELADLLQLKLDKARS